MQSFLMNSNFFHTITIMVRGENIEKAIFKR